MAQLRPSPLWLLASLTGLLWGCASDPGSPGDDDATEGDDDATEEEQEIPPEEDPPVEAMSDVDLLTRISLDLRGIRPSEEEIARVEGDSTEVDLLLSDFLEDPRFADQVVRHFSPLYMTRVDRTDAGYYSGLYDDPTFASEMGQEPLRILARIAQEDLPYTEIVTGNWSMATPSMVAMGLPVTWEEGATGWQPVTYTDSRPKAGILSTNGMWWRYGSTESNANRGRANAVSRILLCNDYLTRPIAFDRNVNLLDGDAVQEALDTNPGCVACHATLDPLAGYFWGYYYAFLYSDLDVMTYHPERENTWEDVTGVAPGYYGLPGRDLADLGRQMASDSRLTQCATEQVFEVLNARDATLSDTASLLAAEEAFQAGGTTLKALFRAVMESPEYRARGSDDPRYPGRKMVDPELLASQIEDLTGYRFTYAGADLMTTDTYGLRALAGGVDGLYVTAAAREPTATMALVVERLAQGAAFFVTEHDRTHPDEARLFTEIGFTETPGSAREPMVRQLQALHLRLFGTRIDADGEEVAANLELWEALFQAQMDPAAAWAGVLSALLRDPDFLFY